MSEPTRDDELVASLWSRAENALREGTATAQADAWYFTQSAVAIERLKAQVGALTRENDEYRNELNRSSRWKSRAEVAEAQAAALRAAAGSAPTTPEVK